MISNKLQMYQIGYHLLHNTNLTDKSFVNGKKAYTFAADFFFVSGRCVWNTYVEYKYKTQIEMFKMSFISDYESPVMEVVEIALEGGYQVSGVIGDHEEEDM